MPFSHSWDWESKKTPILPQVTYVWTAKWEVKLNGLTSKLISDHTQQPTTQRYPIMLQARRQVMSNLVSLSIHVRCKIKKLHEVLMWMRNTGSLYMVKGSYSRAWQAWVYALVLPLASRWLHRTLLTCTSQKQTMIWGWTKRCAFSVSCLRKWTLSHKY